MYHSYQYSDFPTMDFLLNFHRNYRSMESNHILAMNHQMHYCTNRIFHLSACGYPMRVPPAQLYQNRVRNCCCHIPIPNRWL